MERVDEPEHPVGPHVRLARLRVPKEVPSCRASGAWVGIMLLGLAVLGAVTLVIWLPSLLFD